MRSTTEYPLKRIKSKVYKIGSVSVELPGNLIEELLGCW